MTLPYSLEETIMLVFIYSFIGWIVEVIYYGITEGKFINRGFLNGPICPVYGIGFYCVIWAFQPILHNFPALFFGSAVVCTTVELIAGVILYALFHLRWWDYSTYKFNFKGFICLRFSIYWGIACSLGMYMLHPAILKILAFTPAPLINFFILFFVVLTIIDICVTVTAIIGFNKKVKVLSELSGELRKYSDKIGSSIYGTVDVIKNTTTPAIEMTQTEYAQFREMYVAHRKAERELSKKNRDEERQLIMNYANAGRQGIVNTSKAALKAVKLKMPEVKLAGRISFGINDLNADSIKILKLHYADLIGGRTGEAIIEETDEKTDEIEEIEETAEIKKGE